MRDLRPLEGGAAEVVFHLVEGVVVGVNAVKFAHRLGMLVGVMWLVDFL